MGRCTAGKLLLLLSFFFLLFVVTQCRLDPLIKLASDHMDDKLKDEDNTVIGTRWAVLIAGSSGYRNYRHQADICHAYQIMKKGGLRDENIIVFMYDDIAYNLRNPRPGVVINNPQGEDVYAGVPKDYVREDVNVGNVFAVLLGNRTALSGGSGKVVDSGPNDHIFVYYSGHGGAGVVEMPNYPNLFANDLTSVLKKKHASGSYKKMVIYLEACDSGSIFEGLLPPDINIYATTASNVNENSFAFYCPGVLPSPPREYFTCLGNLYSISWMEDSEWHDLQSRSLEKQYQRVKSRTAISMHGRIEFGSHVMQYGNQGISGDKLFLYIGTNPVGGNSTLIGDSSLPSFPRAVNQRDADLVYYQQKFLRSPAGSSRKLNAHKEMLDVMAHRSHVDNSIELVGKLLFGSENGLEVLKAIRPVGKPLVDDWDCLKAMVRTFEASCGSLSEYGMKHMRSLANICNAGVKKETMAVVAAQACLTFPSNHWSSLRKGFSA